MNPKTPVDTAQFDAQLQPEQLRVLSYNIHHCNPPAQPNLIDVDAIAEVIKAQKPDLVALQEVDVHTQRSDDRDQAQLLSAKTSMQVFFARAIDFRGGAYGIAILSRFPIIESHQYALPTELTTEGEARVMATVRVQTKTGFEFVFANTHLDSQDEETNRLLQIEAISKISSTIQLPMIIAGDFNATPASAIIDILDHSFQRTCHSCEPTVPADKPTRTIDFIAYRPAERWSVTEHHVVAESDASDHRPVFSILQVNG